MSWLRVGVMVIAMGFCLGACGHATTPAASIPAGTLPPEVRVPALETYLFPNATMLADRVYLVGRSDHLLAYVYEPADEACGCFSLAIIVQDLTTGAEVWTDRYDSGELERKLPGQLRSVEEVWRVRGPAWEKKVQELGVVREAAQTLRPIATGGTAVPRIAIRSESVGADSAEGYEHLTTYEIDLVTAAGTSVIAKAKAPREYNLLEVTVLGYLAPRAREPAAVLIEERRRGWEGTPHVARLRFVGAPLR